MALSQFGGRPSSGSGSGTGSAADGKEVGEVFLVPNTFVSSDVVEAGSTVTAVSQPTLFPKLVDGGSVVGFSKYTFPDSELLVGTRFTQGILHQGEWFALTVDGKMGSTADGINWTARGTPISSSTLPDSFLWPQPSTPQSGTRGTAIMYSLGSRLVVINTMVKFVVGAYTDNKGATWTSFSDATMNTVFSANLPGTLPMTIFGGVGYAIMVDLVSKKIYRSTTGISNWTDVTPAGVTFPTTASLNKPASFADAASAAWWFGNTMFASVDAGVTWTSAALSATTSAQYGLVSLIKWNGAMYAAGTYNGVGSFYKSADLGATYTASGSMSSGMVTGNLYIGPDGNLGYHGATRQIFSNNGSTWALSGVISPQLNTSMAILFPSGSGYATGLVSTTNGVTRLTADYGATWTAPNKPASIGSSLGGLNLVDCATNEAGLTVMLGAAWAYTASERSATHNPILSSTESTPTKSYYYGSFTSGWTVGQMPVSDMWAGITWNKYAGIFIATAMATDAIFTSTDGINWTTVTATTLGFSPKNLPPRTFGLVTAFVPGFNTATALGMVIGRGDGTWFPQKTAYTKAWTTYGAGGKAVEFNKDYVMVGTAGGYFYPDATLITSATTVSNPGTWSTTQGMGDYVAAHGPVLVTKTTAGVYAVASTPGGKVSGAAQTATYATDAGILCAIWAKDGVITAYVGELQSGNFGLRVRTTTDAGVTWTNSVVTAIPSTERLYAGRVIGNYVMLIGHQNTYVMDASNGGVAATSKTVSTGWVAPTGLKYVVKAK